MVIFHSYVKLPEGNWGFSIHAHLPPETMVDVGKHQKKGPGLFLFL